MLETFFDLSFDVDVPTTYNINNVYVVVMVADAAGAILGGAHTESKTVGANDVNADLFSVGISPNPAFDVAYIDLNLPVKEEVHMQIVNQMGKTVASRNYGSMSGKQVLPVITQDFGKGMYFVKIAAGNTQQTLKLVVE